MSSDHGECKATTVEDWEGILKLADRWVFRDVFNLAVRKLSALEIDPVKKIQLMHKHKIRREWAIDSFVTLTLRDSFPEVEEATILGIELSTYLAKTRERVSYLQPIWNRRRYEPVRAVVCEVFKLNGESKDPKSWKMV